MSVGVICSKTQKEQLKNKLQNYTKKKREEPFVQGQKYYVLDENVPNCVNSIVCNQTFEIGSKHSSLGKDVNGDKRFLKDTCFSYDAKYNTGKEIKQLDTLDSYNEKSKFITQITKGKYKYKLDTPNQNDNIYYRKCPLFGCKSGTSLMDISGGRKTKRKKRLRK